MSTLRPRVPCTIRTRTTAYDRYGQPIHSETERETRCAIIRLTSSVDTTSVRTDSSASRGRAEEVVYDVRLLMAPRESVKRGDLVTVRLKGAEALTVEVMEVHPRADVAGRLHHIEVDGNRWASR